MKSFAIVLLSIISFDLAAQENKSEAVVYPVHGDTEFAIHGAYNSSFLSENGFTPADDSETVSYGS